MKITTLAILGTLIVPFSSSLFAQGQTNPVTPATTGTPVTPAQGTTGTPGTIPTQGLNVDPSVTTTDVQGARDAQAAQQNAVLANPAQSPQQAGAGGVFGPSKGPGIFGPAGQTATTDIYGNRQVTSGPGTTVSNQVAPGNSAVNQASRTTNSNRPGQTTNPSTRPGQPAPAVSLDINGNPIPTDGQVRNELPRDLQPLTSPQSPSQPVQPSGSVTGR
ncbi:MAG: hypothetical protein H7318_16685 [Oligoflexus sp.]|nr:hypothetical protein [Oligoflexus sp.]